MRDLSPAECQDLLAGHRFGRLGVRDAEGVDIVPISYALDGDSIVGHSPAGHKLQLMRLWPHVGFEVDEVRNIAQWRSVLVRGRFREVVAEDERTAARIALLRAFEGSVSAVTAGHGHHVTLADAALFRICIDSLTGRAEGL